jgi:hypothetical protein
MSNRVRGAAVIASVVAAAAAITITVTDSAFASHSGGSNGLTTLNNGMISWESGHPANLTIKDTTTGGGQWSPDGSRMAYVDTSGDVNTVRFDKGSDIVRLTFDDHVPKSDPTWTSDGSMVIWAAHGSLFWTTSDNTLSPLPAGTPVEYKPPAGTTFDNPDGGPNGLIAFDATTGSDTKVVEIAESRLLVLSASTTIVTSGSQPAISPSDPSEVAFVRRDSDGHAQIWRSGSNDGRLVQITSNPVDHSNPTWAPDQNSMPVIAFDEGDKVFTAPSDGSNPDNPAATGLTGTPAYQSTNADTVFRVGGTNRFKTAVAASRTEWSDAGSTVHDGRQPAKAVVLTRSDTFADALAGAPLATDRQGPLLLTPVGSLNPDTASEIKRVFGHNGGTVYILGDTGAISASVETAVQKLGGPGTSYGTVRLQGKNRYGTAVAIAKAISPQPNFIFVTTGLNFPDALAAGAAAGSINWSRVVGGSGNAAVVLLSADDALPAETKAFIDNNQVHAELWGIGAQGGGALANRYFERELFGSNRYQTADAVAATFFTGTTERGFVGAKVTGIATGTNWPDALAGGALMGTLNGPLLLSQQTGVIPETATFLSAESGAYGQALVFGSTDVVSDDTLNRVGAQIGGVVPVNKVIVGPSSTASASWAPILSNTRRR